MTKEEAKKFGLHLLQGIMERNESYPVYADNVKQAIEALSAGSSETPMNHEELQEEIARTYHDGSVADTSDINHISYENIAEYFYELGCRRAAEKYDEIEYNRQRAEEEIPKDLEEAADNYKNDYPNHTDAFAWASKRAFIAGAEWQEGKDNEAAKLAEEKAFFAGVEWQKEQFEKNRLAACENQTKEEYDRETDFALEIINKEHRQPTFSDAINYGMRLQKESMPLPEDTVLFNKGVAEGKRLAEEEQADLLTIAHLQGADQMKKQMMEEAVEGLMAYEPHLRKVIIDLHDIPNGTWNGSGTLVDVIIIKKDDEK